MTADRANAAPFAASRIAARRTPLEHAHVAEGKIVPCRIAGVEAPQGTGDLLRCLPGEVLALGETQVPPELVDVRIDRNEEHLGGNVPKPQVDAIGRANHPAQVEQKALASARAGGISEDVGGSSPLAERASVEAARFTNGLSKGAKRGAQVRFSLEILGKASPERPRYSLDAACPDEEPGQILAPVDPVFPPVEPGEDVELVVGNTRDIGPQAGERLLELRSQCLDVAEGDRRGHQGDELLIGRTVVAVDDRHRIELQTRRHVAARSHPFQRGSNLFPSSSGLPHEGKLAQRS
jgi:hypothetical protein